MTKDFCSMCGKEQTVLGGVVNTVHTGFGNSMVWTFVVCPACAKELEDFIERYDKTED